MLSWRDKMEKTLNELSDFKKDHPNTPLNEMIEEEVDLPVSEPVIDPVNGKATFKTVVKKVKQKSYYTQSIPKMVICGKHFYEPLDSKKYIFKCKNCDYHYQARIPTHKYKPETGELVVRMTGRVI